MPRGCSSRCRGTPAPGRGEKRDRQPGGRGGGGAPRRSLWDDDGRLLRAVVIAVDGEIVDPERLDVGLPRAGEAAEVFLIRPIFGGAGAGGQGTQSATKTLRSRGAAALR